MLHVSDALPAGLYRFRVLARADNGWSGVFQATHFVKSSINSPTVRRTDKNPKEKK